MGKYKLIRVGCKLQKPIGKQRWRSTIGTYGSVKKARNAARHEWRSNFEKSKLKWRNWSRFGGHSLRYGDCVETSSSHEHRDVSWYYTIEYVTG